MIGINQLIRSFKLKKYVKVNRKNQKKFKIQSSILLVPEMVAAGLT